MTTSTNLITAFPLQQESSPVTRPSSQSQAAQQNARATDEAPLCHAEKKGARGRLIRAVDKFKPKDGPKTYLTPELMEKGHKQAEQPSGKYFPAGYIRALRNHSKGQTGSAVANPFTGEVQGVRESKATVTAQSTSKLYQAAMLMTLMGPKGEEELFNTVGDQASMEAFNASLLMPDDYRPVNPFVNQGALAVTNRTWEILKQQGSDKAPEDALLDLLRTLSGNPGLVVDEGVAQSENETGDNNRKLLSEVNEARLKANEQLPLEEQFPPIDVAASAGHYFRQCAIRMSPEDHAKVLWALEHKINPETNQKYLTPSQVKTLKELTAKAGLYDESAKFARKTSEMPVKTKKGDGKKLASSSGVSGTIAKSGVSGTMIGWFPSKIPGQPDIPFGAISEGLNNHGNPKEASKWSTFMGKQKLAFKESDPIKRAMQKVGDLRLGAVYTPKAEISPRDISKQLMRKMQRLDEYRLKQMVVARMDSDGMKNVFVRSEVGFYLKPENPGKPLQNGLKLLTAPDTDGVMRTYTLDPDHNRAAHGGEVHTTGAGKVFVSITPDAEPFQLEELRVDLSFQPVVKPTELEPEGKGKEPSSS